MREKTQTTVKIRATCLDCGEKFDKIVSETANLACHFCKSENVIATVAWSENNDS